MKVQFSADPIDPADVYRLLESAGAGAVGSVLLHFAVVKGQEKEGTCTVAIDYRAKGDVEENLRAIAGVLDERWQLNDVVLLRREGRVGVGEIISLVAVSAASSQDAFEACRFGIESMKKMPTIAKSELYG